MVAPESFEQALHTFDPLLSIRRSASIAGKYVIERDAHVPEHELWFLKRRKERLARFISKELDDRKRAHLIDVHNQVSDEYESARKRKRVVLVVEQFDRRIFDALAMSDVQRYGGYSRYMDEREKAERARERQVERDLARLREDMHNETFDKLNFAWRKKETKLLDYDGRQTLNEMIR